MRTFVSSRNILASHQSPPPGYIEVPVLCADGVEMFSLALRPDIAASIDNFDDDPEFKAFWNAEVWPGFVVIANQMWNRLSAEQRAALRKVA